MAISQEWWDRWWDEDYSWDGLAKKEWAGWVVPDDGEPVPAEDGVEGRQATLQDYWRRAGLAGDVDRPEFQCPQTKRRFTRVHLPLEFRDGSQTLKGTKDAAFSAELNEVLKAELARPIVEAVFASSVELVGPDQRLQWQGAVLLDFYLSGMSTQTRSEDDRIPVSLCAIEAAFSGDTHFDSASFSGEARFDYAAFSGDTYFANVAFSGRGDFTGVTFWQCVFFNGAAFSGDASFSDATFSEHAHFTDVAFSGYASFSDATFSGYALFPYVAFSGHASFKRAAFVTDCSFISTLFLSAVDFSGEGCSSTSDRVNQSITLASQSGDQGGALEGRLTGEPVPLPITRRSVQSFVASSAVFLGPVDFSNRDIFSGSGGVKSNFHGAHFFHLFKLHGSALHRGINFGETHVEAALERGKTQETCLPVPDALKAGLENLKRAIPEKPEAPEEGASEWEKKYYAGAAPRWSAVYEGDIVAFQEWRRSEARAFADGPVEDRIQYFRALEDCYRTLKLFNEDRRDRPEEGRFHRLELIARRRRRRPKYTVPELLAFWRPKEGIPIWERVLSHIYGASSNYGNSVVLPICWLIGGVILFAAIYGAMAALPHHFPTMAEIENALSFSAGRVLPFGPWADPEACSRIGQMLETPGRENCPGGAIPYGTWVPFGLRLLASFQSLSAIILVFLSGLAVRRRFQIN